MASDELLDKVRRAALAALKAGSDAYLQQREEMIRQSMESHRVPTLEESINPPKMIIDVTAPPVDDVTRIESGDTNGDSE